MIAHGDKVVCVETGPIGPWPGTIWLNKGQVYEVSGVLVFTPPWVPEIMVLVHLVGVNPPPPDNGVWAIERFRKIEPASEEFKEMLKAMRPAEEPAAPVKVPEVV